MAHMFRGDFQQKLDSKGRVSVPASFRRVLEQGDPDWQKGLRPRLVIVYGDKLQKYLECFTMRAVDEIDDMIARMPRGSVDRRMMEHYFHGLSHPTEIDADGRLILPQRLRDKIGLMDEAYFFATSDTFKIWNYETFEAEQSAPFDAWRAAQGPDFNIFSLAEKYAPPREEG
ncbi:MraZ protein [Rhodovulum imhoffii]|uniref:Transcriptional regulator MraZ n=1 Tax=Rhodovulum imhoffii TaxID=365340 RepID=A0A2T5BPJ9_9RHOB|nr:MraZ protein [Rhodovulum imhoffii]